MKTQISPEDLDLDFSVQNLVTQHILSATEAKKAASGDRVDIGNGIGVI
jgi:hypothetical protein